MSSKGIHLEPGTAVTLALDGTLVYVEEVTQFHAAVVALPEQPAGRNPEDRVFTPGRVGVKKISPFALPETKFEIAALSERNREFIGTYETLRTKHGPLYVDRTPEEEQAYQLAVAPKPTKEEKAKARAAEKAAAKEAKASAKAAKKAQPRFLQKCVTCGQQAGHPDHIRPEGGTTTEGKHEFVAPEAPAAPAPKAPRAAKVPAGPRPPKPGAVDPAAAYAWSGDDAALAVMAAANPKYKPSNSGAAIVEAIKATGEEGASVNEVICILAEHEKFNTVSAERIEFAFGQLLGAGLIKVAS